MRLAEFKVIGSFIIALFLTQSIAQVPQKKKPNIIYIYADDLGFGELGAYGQKIIKTPNLDNLAKEGMRFTRHYSSAPVCAPARCMLLTGKHSGHSFIRGNYEMGGFSDEKEGGQMPLPEGTVTLVRLLQDAGYKTAAIGKWGLGMANTSGSPNRQGFDYFYGYLDQKQAHNYYPTHLWENGVWDTLNNPSIEVHKKLDPNATDKDFDYFKGKEYSVDKMAEKSEKFIRENKDRPFFLYLPLTIPHVSLQAPDLAVDEYRGKFNEKPYYGQNGYSSTKYPLSTYAAMITYLDTQVGKVIAQIKELGLDENTIIMFSSDNGTTFNGGTDAQFFNSLGGLRGVKGQVYEGGIRVPFIVRWPGVIKAGQTTDFVSVQYDILATLTEIAGAAKVPNDGISLVPVMTGQGKPVQRDYIYFEFPERGGQLAIRFERYKAVKVDMIKNKDAKWELYDMETDEQEKVNIAAHHQELINRLDQIVYKEHWPATIREWEFINPKY
jgi:arylsulfatase A